MFEVLNTHRPDKKADPDVIWVNTVETPPQPEKHALATIETEIPTERIPLTVSQPTTLTCLESASRVLAEAKNISQVKDIRDRAEAIRHYVKERDLGIQAQNDAAELKLRAERRLGELLSEMPKNRGSQGKGVRCHDATTPTLDEIGLDKHDSHRCQRIASLDQSTFEEHITTTRAAEKELTTASVEMRSTQRPSPANSLGFLPIVRCHCA
jgi:hypothetical protein